jgi:NHL repeat
MRRSLVLVLSGTALLVAVVPGATAASPTGAVTSPGVRTLFGPSTLDSPGGLALDTAGDLFVADTGHCRVLVLPARSGKVDGLAVRAGHVAVLAGGSCTGAHSMGHPTALAVDSSGDVYVAEATAQRVQEIRQGGPQLYGSQGQVKGRIIPSPQLVTVAGTGTAGFNGDGLPATASDLDQPTGVAVDRAGDVFIADTANCRVRVLPAHNVTVFGHRVIGRVLTTVAGTGVCGSAGQGGPMTGAELWNPVAVAVQPTGNLVVADSGDQSVLLASAAGGTYWGTPVGAGDIGVVVGGTGGYGPYLADGLAATGETAELNDPRAAAVGPTGALFVSDGFMHAVRVVPETTGTLVGRHMVAGSLNTAIGAVPVSSSAGPGDGTKWVVARVATPVGVAVSGSGSLYVSDAGLDTVRVIGGPAS